MGSYEYFRKIEANGNLLIFCQLHRIGILPRSSGEKKWRHTSEMDRAAEFAVKSQFSS